MLDRFVGIWSWEYFLWGLSENEKERVGNILYIRFRSILETCRFESFKL